jgi:hypothetical protein
LAFDDGLSVVWGSSIFLGAGGAGDLIHEQVAAWAARLSPSGSWPVGAKLATEGSHLSPNVHLIRSLEIGMLFASSGESQQGRRDAAGERGPHPLALLRV